MEDLGPRFFRRLLLMNKVGIHRKRCSRTFRVSLAINSCISGENNVLGTFERIEIELPRDILKYLIIHGRIACNTYGGTPELFPVRGQRHLMVFPLPSTQ
jgi:hypothetical protein